MKKFEILKKTNYFTTESINSLIVKSQTSSQHQTLSTYKFQTLQTLYTKPCFYKFQTFQISNSSFKKRQTKNIYNEKNINRQSK